jgi:secondary thiamine-phosphate synthase enzyme
MLAVAGPPGGTVRPCYHGEDWPAGRLVMKAGAESMRELIRLSSREREELIDITDEVRRIVKDSGVRDGLVSLYAQGATAAVMIQENWDPSVPTDVVNFLRKLIPRGVWLHDRQDGNGDAHLKAGLVGPSETIPLIDGTLGLSRWQNVFFCEFDGPRKDRTVVCTVLADRG